MKCPGQERSYWTGAPTFDIPCPKCGASIEMFRDENGRRCPSCGHRFPNPKAALGCAQWCAQARECIGYVPLQQSAAASPEGTLATRLIQAVEEALALDPPQLARALLTFQHAKQLLEHEGGNARTVLAAALLLPLAAHQSAGSARASVSTGCASDGLEQARRILQSAGFPEAAIADVCRLLGAGRGGEACPGVECKIVRDAELLAQWTEAARRDLPAPENSDDQRFQTTAGKQRARELFRT